MKTNTGDRHCDTVVLKKKTLKENSICKILLFREADRDKPTTVSEPPCRQTVEILCTHSIKYWKLSSLAKAKTGINIQNVKK